MLCSIYAATNLCTQLPFSPLSFCSFGISSSNYTQLGLAFKLYSAEALFNKGYSSLSPTHPIEFFFASLTRLLPGLSLIYLGRMEEGMSELQDATSQKATEEHGVIDEAIRDRGEGYTVFSIVRHFLILVLFSSFP